MSDYYYDNIKPNYRLGTKNIIIDPDNNQLTLSDTSINKVLNINSEQLSNNSGQSLLFSDIYTTVNACNAAVYPPTNSTTLTVVDKIEILDAITTPYYKSELTPAVLTINELATGNYGSLKYNEFRVVNTTGVTNTITENNMIINNTINGESATINQHLIGLSSSTNNLVIINNDISVSEPYIRLDDSLGRRTIYSNVSITADSEYCYTLDNGTRFLKQQNPFSFKNYELLDGGYIEPYMPFVMIQNGDAIKLHRVGDYFDDNGEAGWSCIVSNYGGGDIQIDIADASSWYAFPYGGGQANPINLKKWGTCRITLIYSSIDDQYIWAVSEY